MGRMCYIPSASADQRVCVSVSCSSSLISPHLVLPHLNWRSHPKWVRCDWSRPRRTASSCAVNRPGSTDHSALGSNETRSVEMRSGWGEGRLRSVDKNPPVNHCEVRTKRRLSGDTTRAFCVICTSHNCSWPVISHACSLYAAFHHSVLCSQSVDDGSIPYLHLSRRRLRLTL